MKRSVLFFLVSLIMAACAFAQNKEAMARSDSLFAAGVDLYNAGKYNEAIPLFTESDRIDKAEMDSTNNRRDYASIWLASCYYKTGHEDEAKECSEYYMIEPIDRRLTVASDSLSALGNTCFDDGDVEGALYYYRQCAQMEKSVLGTDNYWYASSTSTIAYFQGLLGNYDEAIALGTEALHITERVLGKEHADYAATLGNMAMFQSSVGNYEEALRIGKEAMEICERTSGKESPGYIWSSFYLGDYYSNLGYFTEALPCYQEAVDIHEQIVGKEDPEHAYLLNALANCQLTLGNLAEATQIVKEALGIFERAGEKETPYYANTLNVLAGCQAASGNYVQALQLAKEALYIIENTEGKDHPDYASTLRNMGDYQCSLGNYTEAIRIVTEALDIYERIAGKESLYYISTLNRVADYRQAAGDYAEAVKLGTEVLQAYERIMGKEYPDYGKIVSSLAGYYASWNKYTEAMQLYKEALEAYEKTLGKESAEYAYGLSGMASCQSRLSNYREARRLEREALDIRERTLGKNHPAYAESLHSLAEYTGALGNYDEAMPIQTEAVDIMAKTMGKENTSYASSLMDLASLYAAMDNYDEAIRLGRESLAIVERTLGKEVPQYASALNTLATFCYNRSNYSEAVRFGMEALEIYRKTIGKERTEYADVLNVLAQCNYAMGNYTEAIRIGQEELDILEKVVGKESYEYAQALNNMAMYRSALGDFVTSIQLGKEALRLLEKYIGKEHPVYATSLNNLAMYYTSMGDHDEAIQLQKEALEIVEKTTGKESYRYATSLNNIAMSYFGAGNADEALRLGKQALEIMEKTRGKEHADYAQALSNMILYTFQCKQYNQTTEYAIATTQAAEKLIRDTFADLTASGRSLFWDKYSGWFENLLPAFTFYIRNDSLIASTYDGTLLSKGLLLNSEMEMNKLLMESGDTAVVAKYQELKTYRALLNQMIEKQYAQLQSITDKAEMEQSKARLEARIDSLDRRLQLRERELVQQSKAYGDYTKNLGIGWRDVQAKLGKKDVAVEFVVFGGMNDSIVYAALTLTKEDKVPRFTPLFELKQMVAVDGYSVYNSTALSDLVWKPLNEVLKGKENIYFAPTGQLHNIAIESIPCYEGAGLMSDHWNLYRLSSTRELALIKDKSEIKDAYLYGGLTYDMDAKEMVADYHKYGNRTRSVDWETVNIARALKLRQADQQILEPLPATKVEAQHIDQSLKSRNVHSTLLTDTLGTEASFKALSGCRPNILHLATHGFYWTESEAKEFDLRSMAMLNNDAQAKYVEDKALTRSGLFLAGAENAFYDVQLPEGVDDGILTAKEISTLDLRGLDLVVLSACETGLGEITGDGVFGLQRGFKKAGANTLMMSLWKVDDDATQMLMSQFYANLAKGASKSTALKDAQAYVRTYENGKYADPGYWAGFILLDAVD